jgi:hypothetical protein
MEGPKKVAPIMRDRVKNISEINEIIKDYGNVDKVGEIDGIKFIDNPEEIEKLENSIIIFTNNYYNAEKSEPNNNLIVYYYFDDIYIYDGITHNYYYSNIANDLANDFFQKNECAYVVFYIH